MKSTALASVLAQIIVALGIFSIGTAAHSQNSSNTSAGKVTAPKVTVPTVMPPKVTPPAAPSGAEAPTGSSTSTNTTAPSAAPTGTASTVVVAPAFTETGFKAASESEGIAILVFSKASDAIWDLQAPALRTVLKESEFAKIPSFQIDLSSQALAEKFLVNTAATIIVYKGGVERIRSQRMTKPDVIRKMLRLSTAL